MSELDPISPEEAVYLYLNDRGDELADATIDSYRHKLICFVKWCQREKVDNLDTSSGRSLSKFKQHRAKDPDLVSLEGLMDCLRGFIR